MASSRKKIRPSSVLIVGLVLLVALTTGIRFQNQPIYDDRAVLEGGIIDRPELLPVALGQRTMFISQVGRQLQPDVDTYRPIPVLTFFVNAAMSGRKLWSYHLTNLALHAACVVLLFAFIRRWIGRGRLKTAAAGAAFFAVSPWLGEAHVWINGRSDTLALAFGLGAALVLVRRERTPLRLFAAFALFFCGLASKETLLLTAPAFLFLPRLPWRERVVRVVPLGIAAAIYLALRVHVLHGMHTHESGSALRTAILRVPALAVDALFHLLLPLPPFLRSLRDDFASISTTLLVFAFVLLGALLALAFRARRRLTSAPFAAVFFLGSIAPVTGITTLLWPGYGRFLYLPAAALALFLADAARLVPPLHSSMRRIPAAFVGLYLLVSSFFLFGFTRDMASNESFYLTATEQRPEQAYGWGFLGAHYVSVGEDDPGIGALKKALAIEPTNQKFRANLVLVLSRKGRCVEAVPLASKGLEYFASTNFAAPFHAALATCAPTVELAVRNLHMCLVLDVEQQIESCEKNLRERLATDPKARAVLREAMASVPDPVFNAKWSKLADE